MAAARARRSGRIQSHDFRTAEDEPKPELTAVAVAADDAQRRHRVLADILEHAFASQRTRVGAVFRRCLCVVFG